MKIRLRKKRFTRYLIKSLMREKVKNVKIKNDWISLEYDGEKIKNKIVIKRHEWFVGSWAKTRDKVYIDDDLKGKKNRDAIAVHEVIEKFVAQKYGLDEDTDAHKIATEKEREYFEKIGGNWRSHQMKVTRVWMREGKK
ncbi:MAG: hypothetical protein QMD36_05285 [Candidatus Aenigmarchaeota archaeon]|nr:hypothetical protein [Candidatus Aenigmarchaeota archaeon]